MVKWPFRKVKWPPTIRDEALMPGELGLRILRYHCSALVENGFHLGSAFFSVNLIGGLRDPSLFVDFVAVPGWWNTVRMKSTLIPVIETLFWKNVMTFLRSKDTTAQTYSRIFLVQYLSIHPSIHPDFLKLNVAFTCYTRTFGSPPHSQHQKWLVWNIMQLHLESL